MIYKRNQYGLYLSLFFFKSKVLCMVYLQYPRVVGSNPTDRYDFLNHRRKFSVPSVLSWYILYYPSYWIFVQRSMTSFTVTLKKDHLEKLFTGRNTKFLL